MSVSPWFIKNGPRETIPCMCWFWTLLQIFLTTNHYRYDKQDHYCGSHWKQKLWKQPRWIKTYFCTMSPRDKYDECDVLVQTGFHCPISSFSVSLSFSVFLVKTTVSFPFLGSFHLEFQNTQLCSLLIPLSVFSGSLCSSFLAARSNFRFSEKINSNLMTKLKFRSNCRPSQKAIDIF